MEETDLDPNALFIQLGMLVVESRLPEPTAKGHRLGPHCPLVGSGPWHSCQNEAFECQRAKTMRKQMQALWRNRVPMCIEVTLLPDCSHGTERVNNSDVMLPIDKTGSLLLEQWTIQVLPKRCSDNPVSVKVLFQAVQSHLYFSQLSAWLNRTHGKFPSNVSYRVSPPGDFCTSSFSQSPELHTFPIAAVSKSLSLRVNVGCMPRVQSIPRIRCRESHGEELKGPDPGGALTSPPSGATFPVPTRGPTPKVTSTTPSYDPNSPRFQKPHIVTEPVENRCTPVNRSSPSRGSLAIDTAVCVQLDSRSAKSPQGVLAPPSTRDHGLPGPTNHTGAIPKRFPRKSPPPSYYDLDYASSAPELESLVDEKTDTKPSSSELTSPKVIVTQKSPSQVFYSRDKVNWFLQHVVNKESSTDSDSSSPDIDRYLSKTLGSRIDPLSPAEMENYLTSLCPTVTSRAKQEYDTLPPGEYNNYYDVRRLENDPNSGKPTSKSSKIKVSNLDEIRTSFSNLLKIKDTDFTHYDKDNVEIKYSTPEEKDIDTDITQESSKPPKLSSTENKTDKPTCDSKPLSLSPKKSSHDPVTFSLSDEEEEVSQYSQTCYSNGASSETNGSSFQNSADDISDKSISNAKKSMDLIQTSHTSEESHENGVSVLNGVNSSQISPAKKLPFHKSVSCPGGSNNKGFSLLQQVSPPAASKHAPNLLKSVIRKEFAESEQNAREDASPPRSVPIPTDFDRVKFRKSLNASANMIFHAATGLPMQSSPAPIKKRTSENFDYDSSLSNPRAIKNSLSCVNLNKQKSEDDSQNNNDQNQRMYSTSAPASTNCLLGNFEESMLNGRLEPSGVVEGFTADIGASGVFCPKHITLPLTAFFFSLSDDNAPSPYLGHINLEPAGKRGYHIPKKGTVQVTMFNPNKTVVKMFVVVYDLSDMTPNCQTFLRQRTLYMPVRGTPSDVPDAPVYLRYLIHLRFSSSKSGKIYLHTDIRLIFARDKFEFDSRVANYELRSFTEGPVNPKFSPKR